MRFLLDSGKPFAIGRWTVSRAENRLRDRDGTSIHLEPRVMDLLCALAARAGEVVSRETLLDQVFGGTHVESDGLFKYVSHLRRALGDDAKAPSYIETIPKRGYRLLVIPQTLTVEPAPTMSVKPRVSVARAWVAASLGAVGIVVLLAIASYMSIPDDDAVPTSTAPTDPSPQARLAFARARVFDESGSCAGYRRAVDEYRTSVTGTRPYRGAFRPYADALVASALLGCMPTATAFDGIESLVNIVPSLTPTERAYAAATRALFFDRDLATAGVLLGEAHSRPRGRSSDVTVAAYLAAGGRLESAIAEAQRALIRDPAAVGENWSVALGLYFARKYEDAEEVLVSARQLHPSSPFLRNLSLLVQLETNPGAARARAMDEPTLEFDRLSFAPAYVLAKTGDRSAARHLAEQWEAQAARVWVPPTSVAAIYQAIGDRAGFARWMKKAQSEHDAWLLFKSVDPTLIMKGTSERETPIPA